MRVGLRLTRGLWVSVYPHRHRATLRRHHVLHAVVLLLLFALYLNLLVPYLLWRYYRAHHI